MLRTLRFIWDHPLASRNRSAAYLRYLKWQIGCRVLRYPIVVPFIGSSKLVIERSMTGATGNYYCGLHEFRDMAFVLHFLRSSDEFVDVGANIGSYTVLASAVVGARSLACEPVPSTFEKMTRNIAVNQIGSLVDARRTAIGESSGTVLFSADKDTMNKVVSGDYRGNSQQVPVVRMDDINQAISSVLWKVDVEGFEAAVLRGAVKSLRAPVLQAVLLEGDTQDVQAVMYDAGFQRATYDPFRRSLTQSNGSPSDKNGSANNLWIRDFDFVSERCRTAPRHALHGCEF